LPLIGDLDGQIQQINKDLRCSGAITLTRRCY